MADTKRTAEIVLKITGFDPALLKPLISAFEGISKAVDNVATKVKSFQDTLTTIKTPASLNTIVKHFQSLEAIKLHAIGTFVNNLKKINDVNATGFKTFVTQMTKLAGLTIPSLLAFKNNITALNKIKKLPDLTPFATALKSLSGIGNITVLTSFVTQMTKLARLTIPSFTKFVTDLKNLVKVDLTGVVANLKAFNNAIVKLEKAGSLDAFKKLATDVNSLKTALAGVAADVNKTAKAVSNAGKRSREASIGLTGFTEKLKSFVEKFRTVATFRSISEVILLVKAAFISGLAAIIEYDQALKDLQAITGATSLEVSQMGTKILEVASSTKFSASEIAEGMRVIGQAGFSASDAIQTMQSISDLATGTLSTMASTVDLVTTAMRVFQIDASQSSQIVDVFANAVNKSKLTIDKLRTAMNYVGPIAKASGIDFKELSAAMGTLANSGLRASTMGTGLRRIFAELVSPSKSLRVAAKEAGVALNELDPTSNSLASVLGNLRLVLDDSSAAFDIFGKRGAAAVLALVGNKGDFRTMLDTVSKTGTAAKMAAIQMEGLGVSFKNLRDRLGVLAIAFGEGGISGAMRVFITVVKGLIISLTYLAETTFGKMVIGLGILVTSITAVSLAFVGLKAATNFIVMHSAIKLLVAEWASAALFFETSMSGLFAIVIKNPIILAIIGTVAALAGIAAVINHTIGNTKELAGEAAKLADKYGTLTDTVNNYKISLIGLDKGSKEVKEANLALRNSLLVTKNEFIELNAEALAVVASINAIDGSVTDGGKALDIYADKLNVLQKNKLVTSTELANKSLQEQTGLISQLGNKFSDLGKMIFMASSELEAFKAKQKEINEYSDLLSKGFDKSGISFEDLGNKILSWDHTKLTSQQEEIIRSYEFINEQSSKYVDWLVKTNQVGLDNTVQSFQDLAEDAGLTGVALTSVVEKLTAFKKVSAEGFSNRIEKWEKDIKNADGSLKDYIATYLKLNGAATDAEKIEANAIKTEQANFILKLNQAKELKQAEIANGVSKKDAAEKYYATERKLIEGSVDVGKHAAESRLIQNAAMLAKLTSDTQNELDKKAEQYKGNADLIEKYHSEIRIKFRAKEAELLAGTFVDEKVREAEYKTHLNRLKTDHSKYINELAIQESQGLITNKEFNRLKLEDNVKLNQELLDLAVAHTDAIKEEDTVKWEKSNAAQLKAEQNLYKSKLAMTVAYNKEVVNLNKDITDADEDYKKKRIKIEEDLRNKLKSIDKEIVDNRKALAAETASDEIDLAEKANVKWRESNDIKSGGDRDRIKAYDKIKQASELLHQAEAEGDEGKLANALKLIKQSETLADGLDNQTQSAAALREVLKATSKARDVKYEIKELELLKKKNEEIADAAADQAKEKELYKVKITEATKALKIITNLEKIRYDAEIAHINAANALKIKNERLRAEYAALGEDFYLTEAQYIAARGVELAKQSKTEIQASTELLEAEKQKAQIKRDAADYVASGGSMSEEEYIKSTTEALKTKHNQVMADTKTEADAINKIAEDNKPIEIIDLTDLGFTVQKAEEIIKRGITEDDLQLMISAKMRVNPEGSVPEMVEWTKNKINEITENVIDVLINIIGIDKIDDLKNKIDSLKDKTVTITTKYKSTGDKPSGYATGGRLPGFGGGDRIPILGEAGEWIINKLAVQKYGDSFLSKLNNMSLPKFQNGGSISPSVSTTSNISNVINKTGSDIFSKINDFGKIILDTGNMKVPVIAHKSVITELSSHLRKSSLMGVN